MAPGESVIFARQSVVRQQLFQLAFHPFASANRTGELAMSIADWDPAACDGQPGLPRSEKETKHNESDNRVNNDRESVARGIADCESDSGEADSGEADSGEADSGESDSGESEASVANVAGTFAKHKHPLHRLAAVRRQQGVSLRNMARRLSADVSSVLHQEQESSDLPLSVLYQWQRALEVPVADLLVDSDAPLSPPVMERARMVKVMKTAVALMEKAHNNSQRRLVTMLMEQLIEIMPELREVSAWHSVGQRRTLEEFGRAIERTLPDELLRRTR
jgi:transcriptional regulator with XRE-family HTH domain